MGRFDDRAQQLRQAHNRKGQNGREMKAKRQPIRKFNFS
jgi:hypothetical protein